MPDEVKITDNLIDELEQSYKQTISTSAQTGSDQAGSSGPRLDDEKQKIAKLLAEINEIMNSKKTLVEGKLNNLKTLKAEIETGLEELKKLESQKDLLEAEQAKIQKNEDEQKQIENEVANIKIEA